MKSSTAGWCVVASMAAFCVPFLPLPWRLRFCVGTLDYVFVALSAWAIPVSLLALAVAVRGILRTTAAVLLTLVTALPLLPLGFLTLATAPQERAWMAQPIAELQAHGRTYRLYGSVASRILQQEIEVPYVVKLVAPLWDEHYEGDVTLRQTADGIVQVVHEDTVLFTVGVDP